MNNTYILCFSESIFKHEIILNKFLQILGAQLILMEWKLAHPQVTNIKLHVVVVMAVVGMIVAGAHLRKIALK